MLELTTLTIHWWSIEAPRRILDKDVEDWIKMLKMPDICMSPEKQEAQWQFAGEKHGCLKYYDYKLLPCMSMQIRMLKLAGTH